MDTAMKGLVLSKEVREQRPGCRIDCRMFSKMEVFRQALKLVADKVPA